MQGKQLATVACVGHAVTTSGHSCLGYFEGLMHNQKDGPGLQDKPRPWEPWWVLLPSRVESFRWEKTRVNGLVAHGHRVRSRQHQAGTASAYEKQGLTVPPPVQAGCSRHLSGTPTKVRRAELRV